MLLAVISKLHSNICRACRYMHFCILANVIISFVACKVTLVQNSTLEYVPKLNGKDHQGS